MRSLMAQTRAHFRRCPRCESEVTRETLAEWFWSQASRGQRGDCWEWLGSRNRFHGYGLVRGALAHRRAYEIAFGPIKDRMVAMHLCGNPPCVNPDHPKLGTPGDNYRDALAKVKIPNYRREPKN